MKPSKELKMILKDPKHWIGWALTTVVLILVFSQLPESFMQSYFKIGLVAFITIVIVDALKHITKLQ